MPSRESKLYLLLISIHGLIRGHDLELGRDADTGGQTLYVVELARALGEREDVENLERYRPPADGEDFDYPERLLPFLRDPDKPLVPALSRPDERKNISALLEAFDDRPGASAAPRGYEVQSVQQTRQADR